MPTRNRRRFISQAVACFLSQEFSGDRELVVIDNGDSVRDLIPESPLFQYFHVGDEHRTTGWMRNEACSRARGRYIVHWDDDDWSGPRRIAEQIKALVQTDRPATGYNFLPFAWDEGRRAWQYLGGNGFACGTSLAYLRSYWAGHRFEDVVIGEDNEFVRQLGGRLVSVSGRSIVARIHGEATCPKIATLTEAVWTGAPGEVWQEIPYEALAACGYPVMPVVRVEPPVDRRRRNGRAA